LQKALRSYITSKRKKGLKQKHAFLYIDVLISVFGSVSLEFVAMKYMQQHKTSKQH